MLLFVKGVSMLYLRFMTKAMTYNVLGLCCVILALLAFIPSMCICAPLMMVNDIIRRKFDFRTFKDAFQLTIFMSLVVPYYFQKLPGIQHLVRWCQDEGPRFNG